MSEARGVLVLDKDGDGSDYILKDDEPVAWVKAGKVAVCIENIGNTVRVSLHPDGYASEYYFDSAFCFHRDADDYIKNKEDN